MASRNGEANDKYKTFVDEYLIDFHGEKAAVRAGYAPKSARSQASKMLALPKVQKYLKKKQNKIANKLEITAERVLQELGRVAFSDVRNLFDDNGAMKPIQSMDRKTTASLAGIEITTSQSEPDKDGTIVVEHTYKIKQWDKNSALEKLAKHLGMFKEDGTSLNVNVTIEGRDADCG